MHQPAIRRQVGDDVLELVARDFAFLFAQVSSSKGDLNVELRGGYFTVYFEGNIVCTVTAKAGKPYLIDIGRAFLPKTNALLTFAESTFGPDPMFGGYRRFAVDAAGARRLLQKAHVRELCKAIRDRRYGEEITVEQSVLADNPPRSEFIIIDRQIADTAWGNRMDLLALQRFPDGVYGFVVLELKLGKNAALGSDVARQLEAYVAHIRHDESAAYKECYEQVYHQKWRLGLIPHEMSERIEIDPTRVEGVVVVVGYSQRAQEHIRSLVAEHPGIRIIWLNNMLTDVNGALK